jgi:hypothetical protein
MFTRNGTQIPHPNLLELVTNETNYGLLQSVTIRDHTIMLAVLSMVHRKQEPSQ